MKKILKSKLLTRLLTIFISVVLIFVGSNLSGVSQSSTVHASGDLTVDFHVPPGNPIFTINNMAPGDSQNKNVDVTNNTTTPKLVSVKGIRIGGVGSDPKIETVLELIIKDGSTPVYGNGSSTGPKTLTNFFADSANPDAIFLNIIPASGHKTYNFEITFPTTGGNEFQQKSVIFDLTFGTIGADHLVINEVYYKVNKNHDVDEHKNWWEFYRNDREHEHDDDRDDHENKKGKNDEWIELYNPTDHDISLKNWSLTDNSGKVAVIHPNKKIKAGGFALLSKDNDTWKFWNENKNALKLELGKQIGNGLDNSGDRLILKDPHGVEVDRVSWGTDTSGFTPPATNPVVSSGNSTERTSPGFDTDKASDWHQQHPPTPGN